MISTLSLAFIVSKTCQCDNILDMTFADRPKFFLLIIFHHTTNPNPKHYSKKNKVDINQIVDRCFYFIIFLYKNKIKNLSSMLRFETHRKNIACNSLYRSCKTYNVRKQVVNSATDHHKLLYFTKEF